MQVLNLVTTINHKNAFTLSLECELDTIEYQLVLGSPECIGFFIALRGFFTPPVMVSNQFKSIHITVELDSSSEYFNEKLS